MGATEGPRDREQLVTAFRARKPWEAEHAALTDREYDEAWETAVERGDWAALTALQQPEVSGEPPAGFAYYERPDFVDRRA